jgi:hypothetical protein
MKNTIIISSGCGKTTLSKKYKKLIDIDSLLTKSEKILLKKILNDRKKDGDFFIMI